MDKKAEIDIIIVLLKSWLAEIKFNTRLDFYDINKISEGLSEKLLNTIFGYNLRDLNKIRRNFPGIDLGDDSKDKLAFQITSRTDFQKFKENLETFVKKDKNGISYSDTFTNGIKFLVLSSEDVKKANTDLSLIYPAFNIKNDILKIVDLLPFIDHLYDTEPDKFIKTKQILEEQFSNKKIEKPLSEKVDIFLKEYESVIVNNFSRINFFGLDLPKRPREIQLYSLFVEPLFKPRNDNVIETKIYNKISSVEFNKTNENYLSALNIDSLTQQLDSIKNIFPTIIDYKDTIINDLKINELFGSNVYDDYFTSILKRRENTISYKDIFNSNRSKVIIGNPGAGKSLLVKQAICKILTKDRSQFKSNFIYDTIPFRIELFKFNKDRNGNGLESYLSNYLKNALGITGINDDLVAYIFAQHKTIVFFDGLDEIFDIQERIEVRDIIENFTNKHDKSISIVTSRFESFEEVNLSTNVFDIFEILDFNIDQVIKYVNKWYDIEEDDELIRNEEIQNCLEQLSKVDKELTTSPLLLSLILILYRNELDIPTTKLEIYESCANTLIETRDVKEKKIELNFKVKNIPAAFAHIAFWQFNLQNIEDQRKEINYSSVLIELKKYLLQQKNSIFQDDNSANLAAKEFLEYAKNRSIYVENNFTHKSFLEYFTAYFIYSNFYYKGNHDFIKEIISKNISKSAWLVVLELLICKIDTGQPDNDIIDGIIEDQLSLNEIVTITFFIQILHHLRNVSEAVVDKMIFLTLRIIINRETEKSTSVFEGLIHLSTINRFKPALKKQFNQTIQSLSDNYLDINNCYILNLEAEISAAKKNVFDIDYDFEKKSNPYNFILEFYPNLLDWTKYFELLKYFLTNFERHFVFNTYSSLTDSKIFFGSANFNWILSFLFSYNDIKQFLRNYGKLKTLGFKNSEIVLIAKTNIKEFDIPQDLLDNYYVVKDYSVRDLLNQICKNRFGITCKDRSEKKVAFFDKSRRDEKFRKK